IMSQFLIAFITLLLASLHGWAAQVTVSNNPNIPAQYSNLQTAIDAVAAGDTLIVSHSNSSYGSIIITKALSVLGQGYYSADGLECTLGNAHIRSSNVTLSGFECSLILNFENSSGLSGMENVKIQNCYITDFDIHGAPNGSSHFLYKGIVVRNCIFHNLSIGMWGNNWNYKTMEIDSMVFENNLFSYFQWVALTTSTIGTETMVFRHNTFVQDNDGNLNATIFKTSLSNSTAVSLALVEDNLFYDVEPGSCPECMYHHNLTYLCAPETLPGAEAYGNDNITGDPLFSNVPLYTPEQFHYWNYNFGITESSPAKNAASDGTDIGMTGGYYPFDLLAPPPGPIITSVSIPSTAIELGGEMQVTIEAISND
ncbi:MAG: hypothetical protein JNM00_10985, partial [Flavobacteriales bacterium]|nr:hypothetical protein [Flavobacteriales bacterium]